MSKKSDFGFYLKTGGPLVVIAACVALLLAIVNSLTSGVIASNKAQETDNAIRALYPDMAYSEDSGYICTKPVNSILVVYGSSDETDASAASDADTDIAAEKTGGTVIGFCVSLNTTGFGGNIEMMVGVSMDEKVTGVKILSLSETPGLGSKVNDSAYLSAYIGKDAGMELKRDVYPVAGATISSKAVMAGVKNALSEVSALLSQNTLYGVSQVESTDVVTEVTDNTVEAEI